MEDSVPDCVTPCPIYWTHLFSDPPSPAHVQIYTLIFSFILYKYKIRAWESLARTRTLTETPDQIYKGSRPPSPFVPYGYASATRNEPRSARHISKRVGNCGISRITSRAKIEQSTTGDRQPETLSQSHLLRACDLAPRHFHFRSNKPTYCQLSSAFVVSPTAKTDRKSGDILLQQKPTPVATKSGRYLSIVRLGVFFREGGGGGEGPELREHYLQYKNQHPGDQSPFIFQPRPSQRLNGNQ